MGGKRRSVASAPTDSSPNLSRFVCSTRCHQGALPSNKMQRLQDMGTASKNARIERNHQKWQSMLERLVECKHQHGDCKVRVVHLDDKKLGNWVETQRACHRRNQLEEDRTQKLNEIGFVWRINEFGESMKHHQGWSQNCLKANGKNASESHWTFRKNTGTL